MEGHPLCQAPPGRTICTCCVRRDQQSCQLPAQLLTWNPPLCAQSRPSQAVERSRLCQAPSGRTIYTGCVRRDQQLSQLPAPLLTCATSGTLYQVTGFCL